MFFVILLQHVEYLPHLILCLEDQFFDFLVLFYYDEVVSDLVDSIDLTQVDVMLLFCWFSGLVQLKSSSWRLLHLTKDGSSVHASFVGGHVVSLAYYVVIIVSAFIFL